MITLRPYQQATLDALWSWFRVHPDGNPVVEACVGAGKSIMIAEMCRAALQQWPGTRILMCVHSKELVEQNYAKLRALWPQAPVGMHSASVGRKDLGNDILFATIGSIAKKSHMLGRVDLVLIDECHLINSKETGQYRQFLADLKRYCPQLRVIGWTGTAFRGNGVWVTDSDEPIFHAIACRVRMSDLLAQGYLAPLRSGATVTQLSAEGVAMRGGDFIVSQLAQAVDKAELVRGACAEIVALGADRRRWLVFAITVQHAEHVCDEFKSHGVAAAVVTADTPKAERERKIADFRAGRLRCLVNIAVLTTGFDVPEVDLIALLRNTRSPVLYVQIAGRGLRTAPGKTDCLWLDFTDTTAVMGPVDAIRGRARPQARASSGGGFKVCDQCGNASAPGARACECGFEFPEPELIKHTTQASSAAVMAAELEPTIVEYRVSKVTYSVHRKEGKPDTLQVDYWAGYRRVASEWVCFDHQGWPRQKAEGWWAQRASIDNIFPYSCEQAAGWLNGGYELKKPMALRVNEQGKFPEIVGFQFGGQA